MRSFTAALIFAGTSLAVLGSVDDRRAWAGEQLNAHFERLSIEQGLSQSIVEKVLQDRRGFMWFVTENGLNRYDGYRFVVYRNSAEDHSSLSHNELKSLYEDSQGILWVGTFSGGLNRFDPSDEKAVRFRHDPDDPGSLAGETVRAIVEDSDGVLWVGTQGAGLDRLDAGTGAFDHYRHDPNDPTSLPHDDVRALLVDSRGSLWVGTLGGLARLEEDGRPFTRISVGSGGATSSGEIGVFALLEDQHGRLWVGGRGGLRVLDPVTLRASVVPVPSGAQEITALVEDHLGFIWLASDGHGVARLDPRTMSAQWFRHDPLDPKSLSTDRVWSLYLDRFRVLWAGTYGGGVNRLDLARKKFHQVSHDPSDPDSLSHDIVWSFLQAPDSSLWVGTDSGGLNHRDPDTGRWRHLRYHEGSTDGLGSDTVRALCLDRRGRLWIATHGGGLSVLDRTTGRLQHFRHDPDDPNSLASDDLRSVMEDRHGMLWIGTFGGGLDRFDPKTGRFTHHQHDSGDPTTLGSDFLRLTYEDSDGVLWAATQGGGLSRLEADGSFTTFRNRPDDPTSLGNDHVFGLLEGKDGRFWVGTFGGGLNLFDRDQGRFRSFTESDGLAGDSIYAMLEDDDGLLWISTPRGLSRFNPETEEFRNFDSRDGLQADEFNGGAAYRSPDGALYFGGIKGFNYFRPEEIVPNPTLPEVVITELQLFNRAVTHGRPLDDGRVLLRHPITSTDTLVLNHDDTVFSLEFSGMHFSAPSKNRYRYILEGFHDEWFTALADRRVATFTNLEPGRYVFRIQASNADGIWNEEGAALEIVITPPYWATWWFRSLVLLLTAGLALLIGRARTKQVRMKGELAAAREAQMGIMPQSEIEVPGFEISGLCCPASEVGGDFYDAFWLEGEPRRLCMIVGDAAGKAMAAAMTAVMSDGMVVSRTSQPGSVEEIMTGLNRSLFSKVPERMFTALCLFVVEPDVRRLEFANAGLCDPLLRTASGVEALVANGSRYPLGRFAETSYRSRVTTLEPGEAVVLFTDGIPEARNRAGDLYGYDAPVRLLNRLDPRRSSASEIRDALLEDVEDFTGGARQSDDLTVVVLRCLP